MMINVVLAPRSPILYIFCKYGNAPNYKGLALSIFCQASSNAGAFVPEAAEVHHPTTWSASKHLHK